MWRGSRSAVRRRRAAASIAPGRRVGDLWTAALAIAIVVGSRRLEHFDAALVGYTFATLFAVFGITYRYAMWLQRPPTRMYWRRGWQAFFSRGAAAAATCASFGRRHVRRRSRPTASSFGADRLRGLAHWLIMWGCMLAAAITFPLVFGWIHFETVPGDLHLYRTFVFGIPDPAFPVDSLVALHRSSTAWCGRRSW